MIVFSFSKQIYLLPILSPDCFHILSFYPILSLSSNHHLSANCKWCFSSLLAQWQCTSVPNIRRLRAFKPIQFLWAARNRYLYLYLRQCKFTCTCTCTCTSDNVPVPQPMYLYLYLRQCTCTPDNVLVPVPQTMYPSGPIFATFKPIHFLWATEKQAIYLVSSYTQRRRATFSAFKKYLSHTSCQFFFQYLFWKTTSVEKQDLRNEIAFSVCPLLQLKLNPFQASSKVLGSV